MEKLNTELFEDWYKEYGCFLDKEVAKVIYKTICKCLIDKLIKIKEFSILTNEFKKLKDGFE